MTQSLSPPLPLLFDSDLSFNSSLFLTLSFSSTTCVLYFVAPILTVSNLYSLLPPFFFLLSSLFSLLSSLLSPLSSLLSHLSSQCIRRYVLTLTATDQSGQVWLSLFNETVKHQLLCSSYLYQSSFLFVLDATFLIQFHFQLSCLEFVRLVMQTNIDIIYFYFKYFFSISVLMSSFLCHIMSSCYITSPHRLSNCSEATRPTSCMKWSVRGTTSSTNKSVLTHCSRRTYCEYVLNLH